MTSHDDALRAEDSLNEIEEFLSGQQDTVDGDDGRPKPNRAMQLLTEVERLRAFVQSALAAPPTTAAPVSETQAGGTAKVALENLMIAANIPLPLRNRAERFLRTSAPHHRAREWYQIIEAMLQAATASPTNENGSGQ